MSILKHSWWHLLYYSSLFTKRNIISWIRYLLPGFFFSIFLSSFCTFKVSFTKKDFNIFQNICSSNMFYSSPGPYLKINFQFIIFLLWFYRETYMKSNIWPTFSYIYFFFKWCIFTFSLLVSKCQIMIFNFYCHSDIHVLQKSNEICFKKIFS